jgi:PBP1b-binding outer membrane lipoprotein LpoB
MKMTTQQFLASLLMLVLFAACSRPVAYFQPSAREHFATAPARTEPVKAVDVPAPVAAETPAPTLATTPTEQVAQANAAISQVDALVRNDAKLATDKTVQKRLSRVRTLLAATSAKATMAPAANAAPKKMNLVERLMVKKLNKKISKQLAPNQPDKAMANTGLLTGGAVLVVIGLLLLLLTSGTGATVGVILLLGGAVILLLGLLAS